MHQLRNFIRAGFGTVLVSLASCGLCHGSGLVRSPFVEERMNDVIEWREWNAETVDAISGAGKPVVFTVSHELNSLSAAMAVESFRNEEIAAAVNEAFLAVAIDKNAYPSVAAFLGASVQHAKEFRDWPLTVFTTPDLEIIDGGGYFPAADSWGNPGFSTVVKSITEAWNQQPEIVADKARGQMEELVAVMGVKSEPSIVFSEELIALAVENLAANFDFDLGGFSMAPKAVSFPELLFLDTAIKSDSSSAGDATRMRDIMVAAVLGGGVRDYVNGGFFSTSSDGAWAVPDFRKSLAIQAQAIAFFSAYPESGDIVGEIAKSVVSEFRDADGFYSEFVVRRMASEAGAAGRGGGLPYAWAHEELTALLTDEELSAFAEYFIIGEDGNISEDQDPAGTYQGLNLLRRPRGSKNMKTPAAVRAALEKLRGTSDARSILSREQVSSVETNALAISALAQASGGQDSEYAIEASALAKRLWDACWDDKEQKLAAAIMGGTSHGGEAAAAGYATFAKALVDVGELSGDDEFIRWAKQLHGVLTERFASAIGPLFTGPADEVGVPLRIFAFEELGSGSANSAFLAYLGRLGAGERAAAILTHLPEDISFSPELFPSILTTAAERNAAD